MKMQKVTFIISLALCFAVVHSAFAADKYWDGGGADDRWLTPENWDNDTLHAPGDRVFLEEDGGTILVETGDFVNPRKILGPTWQNEVTTTLTFTGGSMENTSYWYVGRAAFGTGIVNVVGPTAYVYTRDLNLGDDGAIGILNMTDGVVEVYGGLDLTGLYIPWEDGEFSEGYVNLDGGTLIATRLVMYDGGVIDINDNGLLQLAGDQRTLVNTYITNDYITAENDTKMPLILFDGTDTLVMSPDNNDFLVKAWAPNPGDGDFIPEPIVTLSWRAGTHATHHKVYFGTDQDNLALDATLTVDVNSHNPGSLGFGTTYYWRVDEVNGSDTWTGDIWEFTVRGTLALEEFETYMDSVDLATVWTASGGTSMSLVTAPSQGAQAMQLTYDHSLAPFYSEALATPQYSDFTIYGVVSMDIWYYGDPSNSAEEMYAALSDGTQTAILQNDSIVTQEATWNIWRIALSEFADANPSLDLTSIDTLYIGFGDRQSPAVGGTGTMVIDNIRLWEPRCLYPPETDRNGDCVIDFKDIAEIAAEWTQSGIWP
jgi:hypothetical protein